MDEHSRTVDIADWEAIVSELDRFCVDGMTHVESDMAHCTIGDATIEIHADGRVAGSMPLHEFDGVIETLEFDHVGGTISAESEEITYTFRRPGETIT
ncbi:hypothetical protein [Halalkalicoccus jeotgali]|uniref:Uncharacterized protein n=1 Tax=Halalkalicoccus jeotgali (strain DSM 18796 / CECT 7217 / JCM 14584 / KCTC 4019 / B3) TaxID=795797 RepID=D8J7Q2_HALJB|nr:hypothetical protein [Halalkalicoccus jeotgali]ADJ16072.1 hypothetical protein HacjB3_13455 [Halalkalicoccus jeotgali B3]ELY38168.1 hypothetical protein C497_08659 [Halalkalicoccus jeotgali B3]